MGGGPKWTEEKHPDIQEHLRHIDEDSTYGKPEKLLSWTTDGLRDIERKRAGTVWTGRYAGPRWIDTGSYGIPQTGESEDAAGWQTTPRPERAM